MITPEDAQAVLIKSAAYDQRTVGITDIAAWFEALSLADPPISREDALAAVAQWHVANTDGRMRPAHVIQGAQAIASKRAGAVRRAQLDRQHAIEAAETVDRTAEIAEACRRMAEGMGMGDPAAIHPRQAAWDRKRRQHAERGERSEAITNPLFRGYPPEGGIPFPGDPAVA